MLKKTAIVFSLLWLVAAPSVMAKDDYKEEELPFGYVRSEDAMNSGFHPQADSLLLQAEVENRYGHADKAIHLCQKALEMDPEDIDLHKCYAEALEKKLKKQTEKDAALFMACVGEWLVLMRAERGEEKGLTGPNGIGIPGMTWAYRDEERGIPARQHLTALVGYLPKPWETDQKYMKRVAKAAEAIVNGRVLKKQSGSDTTATVKVHDTTKTAKDGAGL